MRMHSTARWGTNVAGFRGKTAAFVTVRVNIDDFQKSRGW